MRWAAQTDKKPRYGDVRYVKYFPLWPKRVCDKWYWLETIVVCERWSLCRYELTGQGYVGWKPESVVE